MFKKKLFFLVFLVLFLDFSIVNAGGNDPQTSNSKKSDSDKPTKEQFEEERREKDLSEIENFLKYLDENRQRKKVVKNEQRTKDQFALDNLEIKVREQAKRLLDRYARKLPLDKEYEQELFVLKKDLEEIINLIKRIEDRQIQELRSQELRELQLVQQKIKDRKEYDKQQSTLEQLPKDEKVQKQRISEKNILINIEEKVNNGLKRMQDWHTKNQPMNDAHQQILTELNNNWTEWIKQTKRIDDRRYQERYNHIQQITQMKEDVDSHRRFELDQRKIEPPSKSEAAYVQRQKEEFIEDKIDGAIRKRANELLQQLAKNCPLDSAFLHQEDLLIKDVEKLIAHAKSIQQRRIQEQNLIPQDKQGQKQTQIQSAQQQQSGQEAKKRKTSKN